MRMIRKLLVPIVAGALLATSVLGVAAASRRDVFNAQYYADTYADLKAAFGYNEEALYKHYVTYGTVEGRNVSPVLDIVKYRQTYKDLDKAFGDNWDAYVDHYFTYGIKEKRVSGGTFDPVAYAEAYPDIKAAFGNDYKAIINHYLTFGIKEGRTAGVKIQTAPAAAGGGGGDEDDDDGPATPTTKEQAKALTDKIASVTTNNAVELIAEVLKADASVKEEMLLSNEAAVIKLEEAYFTASGNSVSTVSGGNLNTVFDSNDPTITVTGVTLNMTDKESETATVTFSIPANAEAIKNGIVVEQMGGAKAVLSIALTGVSNPSKLAFPVSITMPIPTGLVAEDITVLHYDAQGNPTVIPSKVNKDVNPKTITFVTDSFSNFAFVSGYKGESLVKAAYLQNAVNNATVENTTIKLAEDVTLADGVQLNPKVSITLDLNGHELKGKVGKVALIDMTADKTLTIKSGTIKQTGGYFTVKMAGGSTLNVEADAVIDCSEAPDNDTVYAIDFPGTTNAATANIKGTIKAQIGVYVNGMNKENAQKHVVNLFGTGYIEAKGRGMYLAGNNNTTIQSKAQVIGGLSGIEIRAGVLTVQDKALIQCKEPNVTSGKNSDGTTVNGVPLAVSQHNYDKTNPAITVTVNDGAILQTASDTYLYVSDALADRAATVNNVAVTVAKAVAGKNAVVTSRIAYTVSGSDLVSGGDSEEPVTVTTPKVTIAGVVQPVKLEPAVAQAQ